MLLMLHELWAGGRLTLEKSSSSSRALLDGALPLRYCSARFAGKVATWSLPVPGHVAALFHAGVGSAADAEAQCGDGGFIGLVVLVLVGKESD